MEDFGVPYVLESGGRRTEQFRYHSESTHSGESSIEGGTVGIEAGIDISLAGASSFFVSAAECEIVRLQRLRATALALRAKAGWKFLKYHVVWELFRGTELVFFGSKSGGATVELRGSTPDITRFQSAGKLGASLHFTSKGAMSLQLRAAPGEVASLAVNVFRVRRIADPLTMSFAAGGDEDPDLVEFSDVSDADDFDAVPEALASLDGE